jgi:hypothetical protein
MPLHDIPILTRTVVYNGHTITVRGVSVADIATILPRYGSEIALLFGQVVSQVRDGDSADATDVASIINMIVQRSPLLAAEVIALVTDDYPKGIEVAKRLPVGKQVEILEAAFDCTFESETDLEKLMGVANRLLLATAAAIQRATPVIPSGGGGST